MKDPYLIPGAICEVKTKNTIQLESFTHCFYFSGYINTWPFWDEFMARVGDKQSRTKYLLKEIEYYRVLNTEWTFADECHVCSTVDQDGVVMLWTGPKLPIVFKKSKCWVINGYRKGTKHIECGICPDKTRYEGDAWKTSLRMRPDWAK